ncbi:transposase [Pediococcus acidilactici]|uniref:transposase n=1 Tax=Pediococcus acidilactici TaxID=1254 RepID=UPI0026F6CFD2|nr:transposase [Pediococcus acidilactici]MDO7802897.1 transposase [Pediococcus acidilactici]
MTNISKETKLRALIEYFTGTESKSKIAARYGITLTLFKMLISAYETYGSDVLFSPPQVNGDFKLKLTKWKIRNRASYTEVAAEFGYVGILQIQQWEKIYRKKWVEWVIVYRKRT